MALCPLGEQLCLDAVLIDSDLFSVKGGKIIRPDPVIIGTDKDMIVLGSHSQGGIQDLLRTLLGIRHIAQKIDLPVDQHLEKLRPAALHILIIPPGECGDPPLVHIAIAGTPSELVRMVECGFIPSDAHRLPG